MQFLLKLKLCLLYIWLKYVFCSKRGKKIDFFLRLLICCWKLGLALKNFHFDKSDARYYFYAIYLALLFIQLFSNVKWNSIQFTRLSMVPFAESEMIYSCQRKLKLCVLGQLIILSTDSKYSCTSWLYYDCKNRWV